MKSEGKVLKFNTHLIFMQKPVTLEDVVKLGYPSDDSAIDCTPLPTGTCVEVQGENSSQGMRLADYIADFSQQIPKKVEFHGSNEQIQNALNADLSLYKARRIKLGVAVNAVFWTGLAALTYSFQNMICYSAILLFGWLPILYGFANSNKELLTRYFLRQH